MVSDVKGTPESRIAGMAIYDCLGDGVTVVQPGSHLDEACDLALGYYSGEETLGVERTRVVLLLSMALTEEEVVSERESCVLEGARNCWGV